MKYILTILFITSIFGLKAQELNIKVQVNAPRLQTVDPHSIVQSGQMMNMRILKK